MDSGFDYKQFAILYVDDEEQALKYFHKAVAKDYQVLTAPGVAEALKILEEKGDRIGVLITDQRMPLQTGVDLLARVKQDWPQIVRLLTTAYSDLDSAIDAVNTGAIYQYVAKPWDIRDLRGVLMRAMERFLLERDRNLLLKEKLSALHRVLAVDRLRSLAVISASFAGHFRNAMAACRSYVEAAPRRLPAPIDPLLDVSRLAEEETLAIVHGVDELLEWLGTSEPHAFRTFQPAELLGKIQDPSIQVEIDPALPPIRGQIDMLATTIESLVAAARRASGAEPVRLGVKAESSVWGTPGVRLSLTCPGARWEEEACCELFALLCRPPRGRGLGGMALLAAYFTACHHGGNLLFRPAAPDGAGFEWLIPADPEAASPPVGDLGWLSTALERYDAWLTPGA